MPWGNPELQDTDLQWGLLPGSRQAALGTTDRETTGGLAEPRQGEPPAQVYHHPREAMCRGTGQQPSRVPPDTAAHQDIQPSQASEGSSLSGQESQPHPSPGARASSPTRKVTGEDSWALWGHL